MIFIENSIPPPKVPRAMGEHADTAQRTGGEPSVFT
jgi:hypothetical protein